MKGKDFVTDSNDKKQNGKDGEKPEVVLIAHLIAVLVNGETLDLLPIRHENDVKSDVIKLLEEWSRSGFLLRGNLAYPWHQVRHVEVTLVEELAPHQVHQRLLELEGASRARVQQGFWKTRETSGQDQGDKDKKENDDKKDAGEKKS